MLNENMGITNNDLPDAWYKNNGYEKANIPSRIISFVDNRAYTHLPDLDNNGSLYAKDGVDDVICKTHADDEELAFCYACFLWRKRKEKMFQHWHYSFLSVHNILSLLFS